MKMGNWKDQAFAQQMSAARDFPHHAPLRFKYAICCGHRTGSNLLGEALYESGVAGDPMEYFNLRFLQALIASRKVAQLNVEAYLQEMRARRTSPNGVFGVNVKIDQLNGIFKNNADAYAGLIRDNDFVLYLYRRDKLKQAISVYIARSRDLFNVPSDISDEEVRKLVETIDYDHAGIADCLHGCIQIEQAWLEFFRKYKVDFEPLAYEDFVADYEGTLRGLLTRFGVDREQQRIPPQPLKKVSNRINAEFRSKFSDYLNGLAEPW